MAELLSDLIRIDTTNTGDTATSAGERAAAEWVACKLADVGIESEIHESEPGRASLVARIEGADPSRPPLLVHGHLDVVPADPAEWSVAPVLRRGARRLHLGPRRRRHEGHGRHGAGAGPRLGPHRRAAAARHRAGLRRRRGGRRQARRPLAGRRAPRPLRGLHRGDQRGRRLLHHRPGRPAPLPGADRREGPRLDAADRRRQARPRLVRARRQRRHPAVRGGRPARLRPAAHRADPADAPVPRRGRGRLRHRDRPRRARAGARPAGLDQPDDRRGPAQHRQPHDAHRRLQGQRHPRDGQRHRRRPLPLRAAGGVRAPARRR